jgi:hypothetical protein
LVFKIKELRILIEYQRFIFIFNPTFEPCFIFSLSSKAEARQQEKSNVQKEIRAIRAQEMEKQRKEDEEREKNEHGSRFSRPVPTITNGSSSTSSSAMSKVCASLAGPLHVLEFLFI